MFSFVLTTFEPILDGFLRFSNNPEIQDGHRSEMITQLLSHMSSSDHDADVIGDIFRRTVYPPSLIVIAFIFKDLWDGGNRSLNPSPPPKKRTQPE